MVKKMGDLSEGQMIVLRKELSKASEETRKYLAPILSLQAVQHVLLSYALDTRKSFDEWVWDPSSRTVLDRVKEQQKQMQGPGDAQDQSAFGDMHRTFQQVRLEESRKKNRLQVQRAMVDAWAIQKEQANTCFKNENFYAAFRKYEAVVQTIDEYLQDKQSEKDKPDVWFDMEQLYVTCCTNAAVCSIKREDVSETHKYALKALARNRRCVKAYYCEGKALLMEHRYAESQAIIEQGIDLCEDVQATNLHQLQIQVDTVKKKMARQKQPKINLLPPQKEVSTVYPAEKPNAVDLPIRDYRFISPVSLVNTYCQKSKLVLLVEYLVKEKEHIYVDESKKDLLPTYICNYRDKSNNLVASAESNSKKTAQTLAAAKVITKLWEDAKERNALTETDKENEKLFLEMDRQEMNSNALIQTERNLSEESFIVSNPLDFPLEYDRRFSFGDRLYSDATSVLMNYQSKKMLQVDFQFREFPSTSDGYSKDYECLVTLNNYPVAMNRTNSKKRAKAAASREALQILEQKISLLAASTDVSSPIANPSPMEFSISSSNNDSGV